MTALAIGVGVLTALKPGAAGAVAAALALVALLCSMRSPSSPTDLRGKQFRWVSLAWAYVMIRPIGHFTTGRTTLTAVAGVPSIENLLDLSVHAVIIALAVWSLRSNRLAIRHMGMVIALPALALLSASWSIAPTVTLGFSFELVAITLLAVLTAGIQSADSDLGRTLLRRTLRLIVQLVALLCVLGLVFPHQGDAAVLATANDTRFTWPGEHPLAATAEIGFAFLILLFAAREIRFSWPFRVALLGLFAACLYLGQARTTWAGLLVSALFGYWFVSKGRGAARRVAGAAAIAATLFLIVSSFGGPLTHYIYHGQSQQQVSSLDGRLGLWTFTLHQLHSPQQWLVGYGLGSSRVLLASSVAWAGNAHGAWLELLVSLGLLGVVLGGVLVVALGGRLLRLRPDAPLASRSLPIVFVYVLAMSPLATGFAAPGPEPGLGFGLLAFAYAATVGLQRSVSPAAATSWATHGDRAYVARRDPRLGPAPI